MRERLQLAVFDDFEVVTRQAAHALAVAVGDDHVDVDDVNLHRLAEGRDLCVERCGEKEERGNNGCGASDGFVHGGGLQGQDIIAASFV
jgi:hypothetical protein